MIMTAAMRDADQQSTIGSLVPLLTDIRRVFGTKERITTQALITGLVHLEEPSAEWDRVNRGAAVTDVWLLRRLKGVIQLKDATGTPILRRWREGNQHFRGFQLAHFDDAFSRYLPENATESSEDHHTGAPLSPEDQTTERVTGGGSEVTRDGSVSGGVGSEKSTRHRFSDLNSMANNDKLVAVSGVSSQTAYQHRNTEHTPAEGIEGYVRDIGGQYPVLPDTPDTATNLFNRYSIVDTKNRCRVEKSDPTPPDTTRHHAATDPPPVDPPLVQSSGIQGHVSVAENGAHAAHTSGVETAEPTPDITERW
jgi:hypothetical protein